MGRGLDVARNQAGADADQAVRGVVKAGGKLSKEKQKFLNLGYVAYVTDTEGNLLGLWQSSRL